MELSSLFIASSIASAAGTGVSALAGIQSARNQQAAASLNAQIARRDAGITESQHRRDAARQQATARAQMGASGLMMDGSNLAVLSDRAAQLEEQALLIRYGGEVTARDAEHRAQAFGQQARASAILGAAGVGAGLLSSAYTYRTEFGGATKGPTKR